MRSKKILVKYLLIMAIVGCFAVCFQMQTPASKVAFAQEQTTLDAKYQLNQNAQNLYDYLVPNIQKVASGELSSTRILVDNNLLVEWDIKTAWSAADVGKTPFTVDDVSTLFMKQFQPSKLLYALLHDLPFEMYWVDKTVGMLHSVGGHFENSNFHITEFSIAFCVSQEYQASNYSIQNPQIDITLAQQAQTALQNAKQIVETYKDLSDYQKLLAYKNKICQLVEYNNQAAEDSDTPYGNPWQVVYVFDNNPSTNVVCEGYSKAFQLLCNLSTFESEYIKCYTVTGVMNGATGAGPHMWNVVTMDDELSYLVDITNSDSSTVGHNGGLFLTGYTSGDINGGYAVTLNTTITFTYDETTQGMWGTSAQSILSLSAHAYSAEHPVIETTIDTEIVYDNNDITAGLADTLNADILYAFKGDKFDESIYTWSHSWHADNNNHIGNLLTEPPVNAGYYWLSIKATNKADSSIYYIHNEKIYVKPKQITVISVVASGRGYNGYKNVELTEIVAGGILSGDDVAVVSATANISQANAGVYTTVEISNIVLKGSKKDNYYTDNVIANVQTNPITIEKAKPTCTPQFEKIKTEGKLLAEIEFSAVAKGALNETISGTFVWTDSEGNAIDASSTQITKDVTYYYVFTPNNPNYSATLAEVVLWSSKSESFNIKDLFTSENLPKTIEYAVYALVAIVVLSCIVVVTKKRKVY